MKLHKVKGCVGGLHNSKGQDLVYCIFKVAVSPLMFSPGIDGDVSTCRSMRLAGGGSLDPFVMDDPGEGVVDIWTLSSVEESEL